MTHGVHSNSMWWLPAIAEERKLENWKTGGGCKGWRAIIYFGVAGLGGSDCREATCCIKLSSFVITDSNICDCCNRACSMVVPHVCMYSTCCFSIPPMACIYKMPHKRWIHWNDDFLWSTVTEVMLRTWIMRCFHMWSPIEVEID